MRRLPLLLLIISCSAIAAGPPPESHARLGAAFPDILFAAAQGNRQRLSDYRGQVVLVKLWATWCGICRAKWPRHQALYDELKNEAGVQLITISVFEDQQVSRDWVRARGFDVPLFENLVIDRGAVAVSDGSYLFVNGTPMTFLIDRDGILRKRAVGTAAGSITAAEIRALRG